MCSDDNGGAKGVKGVLGTIIIKRYRLSPWDIFTWPS